MSPPRWFIIHVYSGFEKKVKESIREQADQKGLAERFEQILVPTEEVVEVKRGAKVSSERKFFPGYVLVRMALNDETWSLVRNTAKVTGFLGPGGKPSPIPDHEADRIRSQIAEAKMKDLNANDLDGAVQMIVGSARSMGLEVAE